MEGRHIGAFDGGEVATAIQFMCFVYYEKCFAERILVAIILLLLVPLLGQRGSEAATLYLRFFLHLVPRSPSRRAPRRCLPGRAGPGPGPCCCG